MTAPTMGSVLLGSSNVEAMKEWYSTSFGVTANEMGEHLQGLDATWVRPVEQESFGLIGTLADPDDDYVQIIQWGASPESHRER